MASYNIILLPLNFARSWQKGKISIEGAIQITKPFTVSIKTLRPIEFPIGPWTYWPPLRGAWILNRNQCHWRQAESSGLREGWTDSPLVLTPWWRKRHGEWMQPWPLQWFELTVPTNLKELSIKLFGFIYESINLPQMLSHEGTSQTLAIFKIWICTASGRNELVAAWAVMHCSESKIWDGIGTTSEI